MSTMIAEVYDAFMEAGASEETAKAAARAIPVVENLASKTDLHDVRSEIRDVRSEIRDVRSEIRDVRLETQAELKVLKFAVFSLYPFVLAIAYRIFS